MKLGATKAFAHGPNDSFHKDIKSVTDGLGADVVIEHVASHLAAI